HLDRARRFGGWAHAGEHQRVSGEPVGAQPVRLAVGLVEVDPCIDGVARDGGVEAHRERGPVKLYGSGYGSGHRWSPVLWVIWSRRARTSAAARAWSRGERTSAARAWSSSARASASHSSMNRYRSWV